MVSSQVSVSVSGGWHEARAAMPCGLALKVPEFQTQPSIMVDWGLMIILGAERRRSHLCRACSTFFQFERSSPGELPPQYRSSAILIMIPSFNRSPSTLLMSSSRERFPNLACPWQTAHILVRLGMVWQLRSISWSRVREESGRMRQSSPLR